MLGSTAEYLDREVPNGCVLFVTSSTLLRAQCARPS